MYVVAAYLQADEGLQVRFEEALSKPTRFSASVTFRNRCRSGNLMTVDMRGCTVDTKKARKTGVGLAKDGESVGGVRRALHLLALQLMTNPGDFPDEDVFSMLHRIKALLPPDQHDTKYKTPLGERIQTWVANYQLTR
jgi:hypothetical protein